MRIFGLRIIKEKTYQSFLNQQRINLAEVKNLLARNVTLRTAINRLRGGKR